LGERTPTEQDLFFERLYAAQFLKMRRYALVLLRDPVPAEEVAQDAFLEALLHIDYLMTCEQPEKWLQQTVRFKSLHVLRDRTRDARRLVSLDALGGGGPAAPDTLAEVEEDRAGDLDRTRRRIAEALTPEELRLLRRFALEKASYKVLSEETGLSVAVCQKRVQRARKKLAKIFPGH